MILPWEGGAEKNKLVVKCGSEIVTSVDNWLKDSYKIGGKRQTRLSCMEEEYS